MFYARLSPIRQTFHRRMRWYRHANNAVAAEARPAAPQVNGEPAPPPGGAAAIGSDAGATVVVELVEGSVDGDDVEVVDP
jgi:hypothetical protein